MFCIPVKYGKFVAETSVIVLEVVGLRTEKHTTRFLGTRIIVFQPSYCYARCLILGAYEIYNCLTKVIADHQFGFYHVHISGTFGLSDRTLTWGVLKLKQNLFNKKNIHSIARIPQFCGIKWTFKSYLLRLSER